MNNAKKAKQEALRLLSRREHFSSELRKKLSLKGFLVEEIEGTIQECQRLGLLDDERAATLLVRQLRRQGYGPRLIAAKLHSKGVELSQEVLFQNQQEQIRALVEKKEKFRKRDPAALVRMLMRRGFSLEEILQVVKNNLKLGWLEKDL